MFTTTIRDLLLGGTFVQPRVGQCVKWLPEIAFGLITPTQGNNMQKQWRVWHS